MHDTIMVRLYGMGKGLVFDGPLGANIVEELSDTAKANILEIQAKGYWLEIEELAGPDELRFSVTIGDKHGDYACALLPQFPAATEKLNKFLETHTAANLEAPEYEE